MAVKCSWAPAQTWAALQFASACNRPLRRRRQATSDHRLAHQFGPTDTQLGTDGLAIRVDRCFAQTKMLSNLAVQQALAKGLTQKMLHGAMAELHTGDAPSRERASQAIQHFFLRKDR